MWVPRSTHLNRGLKIFAINTSNCDKLIIWFPGMPSCWGILGLIAQGSVRKKIGFFVTKPFGKQVFYTLCDKNVNEFKCEPPWSCFIYLSIHIHGSMNACGWNTRLTCWHNFEVSLWRSNIISRQARRSIVLSATRFSKKELGKWRISTACSTCCAVGNLLLQIYKI